MSRSRIALLALIALLVGAFFFLDLGRYFNLEYFKAQQASIAAYYQSQPVSALLIYFAVYVAVTGLSLPGAALMTLVGGAIFGLFWGTVVISFASTIGATLAFLVSRFVLRDMVQSKFGRQLSAVNRGIEKDGAFYLFTLRLVPAFPFFIINLVMGLTPMRIWRYYWVSQLGMLPGTLVYVNAGTQLGQIESLQGILSPGLILSFTLLGIFPLLAKKTVDGIKARRVLKPYRKPKPFDRNLVVIGAGSAGLVSAYIAAAVKAKVSLVEKHKMGGDCLNTGCVPSKALIRSAKFLAHIRRAQEFGFHSAQAEFDFGQIMERVQRVVRQVEPHDSVERYTALGVDCIHGEARITSPYTVEVNGRRLSTRSIIIATGGRPFVPSIAGLDNIDFLTSDNVWALRQLPKRLVVLGGGPIGCELAQSFARFGSEVIQVEMGDRIMPREDDEFSARVADGLRADGVDIRTGHTARRVRVDQGRRVLVCEHRGQEQEIEFDQILVAVGRAAHTRGLGLETLGIPVTSRGTVEVNEYLQTRFPNIYACGDVAGPYQFTHTASHQAWYATVNALFGHIKKFKADYSVIPWATFTDPEVARVGLNEQEAQAQGIAYEVTRYGIDDLDRAIADGEAHGEIKVLTVPGKDKILGVTIAGEHAGDLLAEFVTAMRYGLGLNKILGTIHIYPTLAEANKYVAGAWKRAHAPQGALRWLQRYHAWRLA